MRNSGSRQEFSEDYQQRVKYLTGENSGVTASDLYEAGEFLETDFLTCADLYLWKLGRALQRCGYRFIYITDGSHQRVNSRKHSAVATSFYETLIQKAQAINTAERSATVQELEQICREELNHFHLLWDCIERLGADLTVETPSADVSALASQGIRKSWPTQGRLLGNA